MNKTDGETRHNVCNMTVHPEFNKTILFDYDFGILNLCDPLMFDKGKGSVQNIRNVSDPSLFKMCCNAH